MNSASTAAAAALPFRAARPSGETPAPAGPAPAGLASVGSAGSAGSLGMGEATA
jgi:hypothetical protein